MASEPLRITVNKAAPEPALNLVGGPGEGMGTLIIEIGGQRYKDFVQFALKRTAGGDTSSSGMIVMSWPGAESFNQSQADAFEECAKGHAYLDGQLAATFRVWTRESHGTPTSFTLNIEVRGLSADLVDSHALTHPTGEENNKTPFQIMQKLMEGFESKPIDKANFNRIVKKFVIGGETVDRAMRRATREYGLRYTENAQGNLELRKLDYTTGQGQPLKIGHNFTEWSVKKDISVLTEKVMAQGTDLPRDDAYGKVAEEIAGVVTNPYVKCQRRVNVKLDTQHNLQEMKKAAEDNMMRRTLQAVNVTLTLSTWSDDAGRLWEPGTKHHVTIPVDDLDDDLTVETVEYRLTKNQRITIMTLSSRPGMPGGAAQPVLNDGSQATNTGIPASVKDNIWAPNYNGFPNAGTAWNWTPGQS